MATQKPKAWLDKYAQNVPKTLVNTSAPSDATTVIKKLKPINARLVTQEQLDEREAQARRDRIKAANAAKPQMWKSPEGFAAATNAAGDKLRISEYPNIFDDYLNVASMFGHLGSGLGQVPLNIKEGNYEEAAKNILSPVAAGAVEAVAGPLINKGISAGKKAVKSAIDRNFTEVGKQLAQIEKEGVAKGLSPHEIKMQQMEQVGITSAQREGYFPGISDLAHKYVTPYGYDGIFNNKFIDTWKNIKAGGVDHKAISPSRNDSFRLYLGMPQTSKTFEMAQTAPIQHIAYTPKQLKDLEIFSIKNDKDIVFPSVNADGTPRPFQYHHWYKGTDYLDNETVVNSGHEIMGGHNQRLTKAGLEYNDVWDLEPPITPYKYLPKFLQKAFDESPLFFENVRGVATPKRFKIPVDKFLGKPFMVHGVNPEITSTHLVDKMKNAAIREIAVGAPQTYEKYLGYLQKEAPRLTNEELSSDFKFAIEQYNKQLNDAREKLKSLEGYPKFKEGGWLDKYNDGGPVQENYNDYSVSAPKGFVGEGYSNVGRNYSPAWGGQFEDGGTLPIAQNGWLEKLENKVEGFMGRPMDRGTTYAHDDIRNKKSDELDTLRHAYTAMETSDAIKKATGNIPFISDQLAFVGTNALGAGHELTRLFKSTPDELRESGEDIINNFAGSLAGLVPFVSDSDKRKAIQYLSNKGILPDGTTAGRGRTYNVVNKKYAMGGSIGGATQGIPGATGFMYARTGSTPSKGKYAKKNIKTVASAQDGTQIRTNIPVPIDELKKANSSAEAFNKQYVQSPNFVNLLQKQGYTPEEIKRRQDQVLGMTNDDYTYTNFGPNYVYDDDSGKTKIQYNQGGLGDWANFGDIAAHEWGHVGVTRFGEDALKPAEQHMLISRLNMKNVSGDEEAAEHDMAPQENRADLVELRKALQDRGIYDSFKGGKFKQKHLNQLRNYKGDKEEYWNRSMRLYKDKDIIKLMNTIASNDPQQGMPVAQNGMEMKYYQEGLDFKPKSISKNGSVIKDDRGQWAHPGEITEIGSNQITMQGVPYPVLGISDTGDMQMMYPDEEYEYDGESVTEYPMMKQGGQLTKLDQLTNFTNYNTKQPGGWLDKYQ